MAGAGGASDTALLVTFRGPACHRRCCWKTVFACRGRPAAREAVAAGRGRVAPTHPPGGAVRGRRGAARRRPHGAGDGGAAGTTWVALCTRTTVPTIAPAAHMRIMAT